MTTSPDSDPGDHSAWSTNPGNSQLVVRDAFLLSCCDGKDVLHLGATDSPFTEAAASEGRLLHQQLGGVARSLRGLDVDAAAISMLRSRFGIDDIEWADLSLDQEARWPAAEVVMCCDVIEHVDNPGVLLENCGRLCLPGGDLIVSTINALSIKIGLRALLGREAVHPDHVAYYSLATLRALLRRHGFDVRDWRYFAYDTVGSLAAMSFSVLHRIAPQTADGIVVIARKRDGRPRD